MSAFEQYAVQRIVDQAKDLGVTIPPELTEFLDCGAGSYAARAWAKAHPEDEGSGCCWGDVTGGPSHCICWIPVYEQEQQAPRPPSGPQDLTVQERMCGDCAFRKDSPERADEWSEMALFQLAADGKPFWCHEGMRRPVRWEHPDGRTVEGSPDDWQPPMVDGVPFRLDGSPGLLCAGWAARTARAVVAGGGSA